MRRNISETISHGTLANIIDYVRDHYALEGIKNSEWIYLTEHERSQGDLESTYNLIPFSDFDVYRQFEIH